MDIDSMLEISSQKVLNVLENLDTVTQTIIPEKFRLYESNKKGVLKHPTGLCMGPNCTLVITDAGKGALYIARLHYPVDVYLVTAGLQKPMMPMYHNGIIYITTEVGVYYVDIDGNTILEPDQMTIVKLKQELAKRNMLQPRKKYSKVEMQRLLQDWINENKSTEGGQYEEPGMAHDGDKKKYKRKLYKMTFDEELTPGAIAVDNDGNVFVSDLTAGFVGKYKVHANGIAISASLQIKYNIHIPHINSILIQERTIYVASSASTGGIFTFNMDEDHSLTKPPALNRLLSNGSNDCQKVHSMAFHEQHNIVFTDSNGHQIKKLDAHGEVTTISGTVSGCVDGTTPQFVQPTGICTESNTIYIADAAMGYIRLTSEVSALVAFLRILHEYSRMFGLHLPKEPKKMVKLEDACNQMVVILDYLSGHVQTIKEKFGLSREPLSPDGAVTPQIMKDLSMQLSSMRSLKMTLDINPEYTAIITSFTTLLCEHFFAEMRDTYEMPLMHQFAISFSACTREMMKR